MWLVSRYCRYHVSAALMWPIVCTVFESVQSLIPWPKVHPIVYLDQREQYTLARIHTTVTYTECTQNVPGVNVRQPHLVITVITHFI